METILVNLLIAVIVFAVIVAVIRAMTPNYLDADISRIAVMVVGAIFLVYLLVAVLLPLIHLSPNYGSLLSGAPYA